MIRVGIGYDSHRFAEGRSLVLGGVTIPWHLGLAGHSDADAVAHAVTDALLGAAALGDIGRHFPDTDPRWKDADSMALLRAARELAAGQGAIPRQVDVTVIMETPKLAPHAEAMAVNLAACLGLAPGMVSVKGKTNEGMGFVGRGEGVAVMAVMTVEAS